MGLQGLGSLVTGPPEPLRGARVVISTDSNDTAGGTWAWGAGEVAPKDRSGHHCHTLGAAGLGILLRLAT